MNNNSIYKILGCVAIIGNILFCLWLLFNGMDEGWKASPMQMVSYVCLICLLIVNSVLILRKK